MINNWTAELDEANCVGIRVLFADFSKAFDKMSHPLLLQRQCDLKVNPGLVELTSNFLSCRKQAVTNYRSKPAAESEYKNLDCGVPQGSILGPWLWITYANSIGDDFDGVTSQKYADDTTCYQPLFKNDIEIEMKRESGDRYVEPATDKDHLQDSFSALEKWSDRSNMALNEKKTSFMFITKRLNLESTLFFNNGSTVAQTDCQRVLGVLIDRHLNFKQHVLSIVKKISLLDSTG